MGNKKRTMKKLKLTRLSKPLSANPFNWFFFSGLTRSGSTRYVKQSAPALLSLSLVDIVLMKKDRVYSTTRTKINNIIRNHPD
jgi:hypothetical protein